MASLNKVMIIGNLVRDPEMRVTNTAQIPVTSFRIASTRRIRSKQNDSFRDETCFIDVETWGRLAEFCNNYLRKGRPVFIDGRLRLHEWNAPDGQKRSQIRIVAEAVQDLGPRQPRDEQGAGGGGGYDEEGGGGGGGGRSYGGEDRGPQDRGARGGYGGGGGGYAPRSRPRPEGAPAPKGGGGGEDAPPPPADNDYYGPPGAPPAEPPADGEPPAGDDSVPF